MRLKRFVELHFYGYKATLAHALKQRSEQIQVFYGQHANKFD